MKDVAFLITAFDQLREVRFTIDMLRNKWESTKNSPIVLVVSGDFDREITYSDDPLTRVVHLDDMVGSKFNSLVSTSIMKQLEHGMIEVRDLEREHGIIRSIIHLHGDILLLGEKGFLQTYEKWRVSGLPIAVDSVAPNGPHAVELDGRAMEIKFFGHEIMPQLFAVDHSFCKSNGFMYSMPIMGDLEKRATEWALIGNLHRATSDLRYLILNVDVWEHEMGPYYSTYTGLVHTVKEGRAQWATHSHWGGFAHFGNSLHYTKEQRESRNEAALRQYGLDLEAWG